MSRTPLKAFLFFLVLVSLSSCGYKSQGYRLADVPVEPARDVSCAVEIFSAPPNREFRELGFVAFEKGRPPESFAEAQDQAHPYVCAAGGDGAIVFKDRRGAYARVAIIQLVRKPKMRPLKR